MVRAIRAARRFAAGCGVAEAAVDRLCLVVDEWLTNVVEHGRPFDPRAAAAFEGPNPDRGGGAGLELVRAWSQIADYRRRRGRNRLVLVMAAG